MKPQERRFRLVVVIAGAGLGLVIFALWWFDRRESSPLPDARIPAPVPPRHTVESALAMVEDSVETRLGQKFRAHDLAWPYVGEVTLIAFKDTLRLEVYAKSGVAGGPDSDWLRITTYPILAASGELGPKLHEGDRQVPEGIYGIEYLNPNSRYHLSAKLTFPNVDDWARAREDGRDQPGSDIFIHGKSTSIGCLAMGDPAAEDLFSLIAHAGQQNVQVIIAPTDFRQNNEVPNLPKNLPGWTPDLYEKIRESLQSFPISSSES